MKLFSLMSTAFDNFDSTVKAYLSKVFNTIGFDYTENNIYSIIFEGIKGVMQNMMFYVEDALTEQNIQTATRKQSVYSLAKLSGYDPYYGSAATGTLIGRMRITNGISNDSTKIYIPNYTAIKCIDTGIEYILMLPTNNYVFDITRPLQSHEFKVVQGMMNIAQYIAKGSIMETIMVNVIGLWDRSYIKVYVDGKEWQQTANIYDMSEDGQEYVLSVGYEGAFSVIFGNGTYGRRLINGQNIVIEYITHSGSTGNIPSSKNYVFKFDDYGIDGAGDSININDYMTLTMNNCISGGANSDSIEFVRHMAGCNSRSLVLASDDNFKLFLSRFSFIGYADCWSESDSMSITVTAMNDKLKTATTSEQYFNATSPENGGIESILLNDDQKGLIQAALENSKKTYAGITMHFQDPLIRRFALICYVKASSEYEKETLKTNISDVIARFFIDLKNDRMIDTQFIAKSDIIKAVLDELPNIKAFDIDILSETAEQAYSNGYYYRYGMGQKKNGSYAYIKTKVFYEKDATPCLDVFGNISLDTKMEIPLLQKGIKYYAGKETGDKANILTMDAINFVFI